METHKWNKNPLIHILTVKITDKKSDLGCTKAKQNNRIDKNNIYMAEI